MSSIVFNQRNICPDTGKVMFATKLLAGASANLINGQHKIYNTGQRRRKLIRTGGHVTPYKCDYCKNFHLSSQTDATNNKPGRKK